MKEQVFRDLGFTNAETKVYISLLKLGESKAGRIIESTNLQSSTIHHILNSLTEKGIVRSIFKSKVKLYSASNPESILENFKERENKFKEIIPELKSIQMKYEESLNAEVYRGTKGVKTLLNELIQDSKPGDEFYFFAADISIQSEEIIEFFKDYDIKRVSKKLVIKGIAHKNMKKEYKKKRHHKMKYTNSPIPSNIGICNNKMILIYWGEEPSGVLITSKQIVDSQINFFNALWNKL